MLNLRRDALSLDGDRVSIVDAPTGDILVLHALLDRGGICPPDAARHHRAFVRYFNKVAQDCADLGINLSGCECEVMLSRPVTSVAIVANGDASTLDELIRCWGEYLWRWGALFARRDPVSVLFTPLWLPFEEMDLIYFRHRVATPPDFDPRVFAETAKAPFTMLEAQVACHDREDAACLFSLTDPH